MLLMKFRGYLLNNRAKKDSETILSILQINQCDTIADIGSGGGYLTFKFADKVTPKGKVFSIDTNKNLLLNLDKSLKTNGYSNVETLLGESDNCSLPKSSCDLIFMRNVFHHIENPTNYFSGLKEYLKENGKIAIIDYLPNIKGNRISYTKHCTEEKEIIKVMTVSGFNHVDSFKVLHGQSFNIFTK